MAFQTPEQLNLLITGYFFMVLGALCSYYFVFLWSGSSSFGRKLPPGPRALPIVGNLHQLAGKHPHRAIADMAQKYGHIVFLRLGQVPTVVIDSMDLISQVTKDLDNVFCSRPTNTFTRILLYDQHDFGMAPYGAHWRHMRRVCVHEILTPKRLLSTTSIRNEENLLVIKTIAVAAEQGKAVDIREKFTDLSLNVIIRLMIGSQGGHLHELKRFVHEALRLLGVMPIQDFIPFLGWLDPNGAVKAMHQVHQVQDHKLNIIIQEHRDLASGKLPGGKPDDFVSVLLDTPGVNGEPQLDEKAIKACISDLLAGTDTSTITNDWAMTEIIRHPKIQQKLHDELDSVVGRDRIVEETDLVKLHYLICIIKETLRLHPANCFTLPRQSMDDTKLAGYDIPKGSTILFNLFSIGRDADVWTDPLKFDPERWADSSNPSGLVDERLYVFGAGRRACPGYNLGTTLVLLSLARLFHGFTWSLPPGVFADDIDMSETAGFANPRKDRLLAVPKPRIAPHLYGGAT
ncbi:hypothetical protein KC19_10G170000 [Ceratodon purpureus]|uniref:Cytochrome P450 n=1 Tax=Ceratodon purpureus TaxID=3225 RepID=A0A8T0GPU5_CERPU|nr:hypothetical protein KC19_10G170000 [Ceratodon purpureus]